MYTEEMKLWLFDISHGNMNDNDILKGFIKHYILCNRTIADMIQDIVFHTMYGEDGVRTAKESVTRVLTDKI